MNDAESSVVVVIPCRQAVHSVGGHLRFASFTAVAAAAVCGGGGGQRRHAGLGDGAGHHVV